MHMYTPSHTHSDWQIVAMLPYTAVETCPGSVYSYSNLGYLFLGRVIEVLAGCVPGAVSAALYRVRERGAEQGTHTSAAGPCRRGSLHVHPPPPFSAPLFPFPYVHGLGAAHCVLSAAAVRAGREPYQTYVDKQVCVREVDVACGGRCV